MRTLRSANYRRHCPPLCKSICEILLSAAYMYLSVSVCVCVCTAVATAANFYFYCDNFSLLLLF